MNQRTHSWIAIRAIALIEDEDQERNLVKLLKPHARSASVGAWIPDQVDAKRGGAGSATENHVLKIERFDGPLPERFVCRKNELLKRIGMHRMAAQFLHGDDSLPPDWWDQPYKGDVPKAGQHLPNRIMGLSTMMKDLLLMGDPEIDALIPGDVRFAESLDDEARTQEAAAAMYFFMLSHFVADVSMPCHCDARWLSAYDNGLHMELEGHWSKKVGTAFEKDHLLPSDAEDMSPAEADADANAVLQQARGLDAKFDLDFSSTSIPDLQPKQDPWLEFVNMCRASFAVASIIAPPDSYPYGDAETPAPFDTVLGAGNPQLQKKIDQVALYDAVLNTAILWKHIWNKVSTH